MDLNNKKINVKAYADKNRITLEQAHKEIQGYLFEQGFKWMSGDTKVLYPQNNYLYLTCDGLARDPEDSHEGFSEDSNEELKFTREVIVKLTPVLVEEELVELNGVKYRKSDLEAVLAKLQPVEE